jgi:hypothetical protein
MTPRDLGDRFLAKAAQDEALIDRVISTTCLLGKKNVR